MADRKWHWRIGVEEMMTTGAARVVLAPCQGVPGTQRGSVMADGRERDDPSEDGGWPRCETVFW